ncbi:MAG: hypothetical protein ACYS8Z_22740 [Planctomycetota bacterium]|jgi:hypothetical protein
MRENVKKSPDSCAFLLKTGTGGPRKCAFLQIPNYPYNCLSTQHLTSVVTQIPTKPGVQLGGKKPNFSPKNALSLISSARKAAIFSPKMHRVAFAARLPAKPSFLPSPRFFFRGRLKYPFDPQKNIERSEIPICRESIINGKLNPPVSLAYPPC